MKLSFFLYVIFTEFHFSFLLHIARKKIIIKKNG